MRPWHRSQLRARPLSTPPSVSSILTFSSILFAFHPPLHGTSNLTMLCFSVIVVMARRLNILKRWTVNNGFYCFSGDCVRQTKWRAVTLGCLTFIITVIVTLMISLWWCGVYCLWWLIVCDYLFNQLSSRHWKDLLSLRLGWDTDIHHRLLSVYRKRWNVINKNVFFLADATSSLQVPTCCLICRHPCGTKPR